jgi:beta-phosphoglucomutase family hydrolase
MPQLPDTIRACLFDLDGVLTDTARVHETAWGATFEAAGHGPFTHADYLAHVDGRPREDGVRTFLAARGAPADDATVRRLADEKTAAFLRAVEQDGVEQLPGAADFVDAAHANGLGCVLVTSSSNSAVVLEAAGLTGRFDAIVDGTVRTERGLAGKPAPDTFLAGAELVGAEPAAAAVFEDAVSGVQAGRAGRFGLVVGVDRTGDPDALRAHGADVVVRDLAELL